MKTFNLKSCFKLGLSLLAAASMSQLPDAHAASYYVATTGNDTYAGTLGAPFRNIQKAASIMVAGDTCYIRTGIYRETVIPANSGTSTAPITFMPYSNEQVVVSGADLLTPTWSVYTGPIYQATTTASFAQLFVNGNMMNEARWPQASINNLLDMTRDTVTSSTGYTDLTSNNLPSVNLVGAKVHVFPGTAGGEYVAYNRTITAHNTTTKTISWTGNVGMQIKPGNPFYIFGKLSLLDGPGEWFLDDAADKVYLRAPNNASPATHTVEIKARDLAFKFDDRSYVKVQGVFVFAAGISMRNTNFCSVTGCHLRYVMHSTAADGFTSSVPIACYIGGTGSKWLDSSITYSSQSGISVIGTNAEINNCIIRDVNYFPGNYHSSVNLSGSGHKVIGNSFTGSGRFLIWHPANSVEIAYNDLSWGNKLTKDGGATYVYNWNGNGTNIHHNWVHDSSRGIYLDNSTSNFNVYKNVSWNNEIGIQLNSPSSNNKAYNNTLVNNPVSFYTWDPTGVPNQTGTQIINNITSGTNIFATGTGAPTLAKNGPYPPIGSDFVPQAGSGAIDNGNLLPPYTDGYAGSAPDIGAYESGVTPWTAGSTLIIPPFPSITSMGKSYIVDNADASGVTITGSWITSTTPGGYQGSNYLHDGNTGSSGGKSVRFAPNLTSAGMYDVYIRWTAAADRATNALLDVNHASGTMPLAINQQLNNARWVYLGTFNFNAGTAGNVTIRNNSANGIVVADAVRFVQIAP